VFFWGTKNDSNPPAPMTSSNHPPVPWFQIGGVYELDLLPGRRVEGVSWGSGRFSNFFGGSVFFTGEKNFPMEMSPITNPRRSGRIQEEC